MSVLEETIAPTSEVLGGNYIFPLSHCFLNEPDCILLDSYNGRVVCCSEFTPVRVALTYR